MLKWCTHWSVVLQLTNWPLEGIWFQCFFNRIVVVGFPLGPLAYLVSGSWPEIPSHGVGLNFNQNQLIIPITLCRYILKWVTVIGYRVYRWVKLMIIFLLQYCAKCLPAPWMLFSWNEASNWASAWFLCVWWHKHLVSSEVGLHHQVMEWLLFK